MNPVAKGWLRASIDLWRRLCKVPFDSLLGMAVRESLASHAGEGGGSAPTELGWTVYAYSTPMPHQKQLPMLPDACYPSNDAVRQGIRLLGNAAELNLLS